jgi:hypothetical protein
MYGKDEAAAGESRTLPRIRPADLPSLKRHRQAGAPRERVKVSHNNEMNQTNRGVTVSRSGAPSGEPALAEVGAPFILSLGVAGYLSVIGPHGR